VKLFALPAAARLRKLRSQLSKFEQLGLAVLETGEFVEHEEGVFVRQHFHEDALPLEAFVPAFRVQLWQPHLLQVAARLVSHGQRPRDPVEVLLQLHDVPLRDQCVQRHRVLACCNCSVVVVLLGHPVSVSEVKKLPGHYIFCEGKVTFYYFLPFRMLGVRRMNGQLV